MQLGRIDDATTANVGLIRGGVAGNIVPPECRVWAEARSRDGDRLREQVQSMLDAATYAANLSDCELETRIVSEYEGYRFARTHDAVRLVSQALDGCGYPVTYIESGGGADANVFNAAGVPCVNVCNGMAEIHTASEHIAVADLEGMLGVTMGLIEAARTAGTSGLSSQCLTRSGGCKPSRCGVLGRANTPPVLTLPASLHRSVFARHLQTNITRRPTRIAQPDHDGGMG